MIKLSVKRLNIYLFLLTASAFVLFGFYFFYSNSYVEGIICLTIGIPLIFALYFFTFEVIVRDNKISIHRFFGKKQIIEHFDLKKVKLVFHNNEEVAERKNKLMFSLTYYILNKLLGNNLSLKILNENFTLFSFSNYNIDKLAKILNQNK